MQNKYKANLDESVFMINIETLNINVIFGIFHKTNGHQSSQLITKVQENQAYVVKYIEEKYNNIQYLLHSNP